METKALDAIEEARIRPTIFEHFAGCPFIPETVSKKYGDIQNDSICMFAQQGSGTYLKRYVSGSFKAQYPFFIRYRAKPTTNQTRIKAEELLDAVARYICGDIVSYGGTEYQKGYPVLGDGRTIEKIEAGTVYMAQKSEDGSIDYQVLLSLTYSKKGQ